MPQAIELHDSRVICITQQDGQVVVEMEVYLHVSDGTPAVDGGTGWTQRASVTLDGATIITAAVAPFGIVDGLLAVGGERFDNLIPLPFSTVGEARLELVTDRGQSLSVRAERASIQLKGEPTFVGDVKLF